MKHRESVEKKISDSLLPNAVILTAIEVEYNAIKEHLVPDSIKETVHPKGNVYEKGIFKGEYHNWEIGIAQVGAGNNTCAYQTERAISFFNPQVILFVGIAGGIKDLKLGDVLAAEKAYGYERGKVAPSGFLPRPEVGYSSFPIFERAKAESRKNDWKKRLPEGKEKSKIKAKTGAIAAGEKVVTEIRSDVYDLIYRNYNDTLAVEMEGSGFYTACHANGGLEFLIVRGISDLLNDKSKTDFEGFQEFAARNASAFAFEVLSKFKIK